MKIKHLFGPKSGTIEHIDNSTGNLLIAAGLAEHIPYKDFRERLREEGQGMQTPDPNFVVGVQWQVKERLLGPVGSSSAYIERRSMSGTTCADSPDCFTDCPANIRAQWLAFNKREDPDAVVERQQQEKYRRDAQQKEQNALENGRARVILIGVK